MVDLHEAAETLMKEKIRQCNKCPHCGDRLSGYKWCNDCGDITHLDEYLDDQLDKVNAKIYRSIKGVRTSKTPTET